MTRTCAVVSLFLCGNLGMAQSRLDRLATITQLGVPKPAGGKYFFTKREGKQNQPVLYVRLPLQAPRILVDVNKLAADGTTALDWYFPSNDGELLAYGISVGGNE